MEATPSGAFGPLQAIALALIQGITEFLPVSSSAHLILPAALLGWPDQGLTFDVAVHGGTLLAVVVHLRRELGGFAASGWGLLGVGGSGRVWDDNLALLLRLGIASLPIAAAGWLFADAIETYARTATVIATTTLAFGIVLWWADHRAKPGPANAMPTIGVALAIGVAQALALVPGTSRAGITITAALLLGLGRTAAVRFSFLLAIPAIAGAVALQLPAAIAQGNATPWPLLALGFAIAAASAFATITALVAFVERIGLAPFAIYRIGLGVGLFALVFGGMAA